MQSSGRGVSIVSMTTRRALLPAVGVLMIAMLAGSPAGYATVSGKDGVVVYGSSGGDLFSMNANGTNKVRLMRTAAQEFEPAFAPCGCRLAFARYENGSDDLWVMNLDGSNRFKLVGWSSNEAQPVWSPGGTKIAFSSNHDGNAEIYVVQAARTHPAPIKLPIPPSPTGTTNRTGRPTARESRGS